MLVRTPIWGNNHILTPNGINSFLWEVMPVRTSIWEVIIDMTSDGINSFLWEIMPVSLNMGKQS